MVVHACTYGVPVWGYNSQAQVGYDWTISSFSVQAIHVITYKHVHIQHTSERQTQMHYTHTYGQTHRIRIV